MQMGPSRVAIMAYECGSSSDIMSWLLLVGEMRFRWGVMYALSSVGLSCVLAREKLSSSYWMFAKKILDASRPRSKA